MPPTQTRVPVVENVRLARDTYRVRLATPEIAAGILPGQFVMLREPDRTDPLLGRPLALYDTYLDAAGRPAGIDIVYLVIGKMTRRMAGWREGHQVELWGPLGNGFSRRSCRHLLMVGGGIGQTPLLALARQALGLREYGHGGAGTSDVSPPRVSPPRVPTVSLCYGTRTADLLAGVEDFEALGVNVRLSTDDGSAGHHGYVTDLAAQLLARDSQPVPQGGGGDAEARGRGDIKPLSSPYPCDAPDYLVGCGPEPMMAALARLAMARGVAGELSLETPMACGFGACFSCVARIRQPDLAAEEGRDWDYRRTCVEGPVFPIDRVLF